MSSRNIARIDAILGASGSGKSSLIKIETVREKPARLMVWDPKREYGAFGSTVATLAELAAGAIGAARFRLVFHPARTRKAMREQFSLFCRIADQVRDVKVIADELADVTEPGWAPEGWEMLTRQGRHAGIGIQGASQRPADVDKSFYGNASRVVVFRLNAEGDVDRMAKLLGRPRAEVMSLAPLEYLERDMRSGTVTRKKLTDRDMRRIPA